MLVTDFVQVDLEALVLPRARAAIEDNHPAPERLVINVYHDYEIVCEELQYDTSGKLSRHCLDEEHWLIAIKGIDIALAELEQELRLEAGTGQGHSEKTVMLRSDAGAPYGVTRKVLEACGRAEIWKLEIGATKPAE